MRRPAPPHLLALLLAGCSAFGYARPADEVGDLCDDGLDNDFDGTRDEGEVGMVDGVPVPVCAAWHIDVGDVLPPARPRGECPEGWSPSPCRPPPSTRPEVLARVTFPDTDPMMAPSVRVSAAALPGGDGTPDREVRSIGEGIMLALAGSIPTVMVGDGVYEEDVELPPGIALLGTSADLGGVRISGRLIAGACPVPGPSEITATGFEVTGGIEVRADCVMDLGRGRSLGTVFVRAGATFDADDFEIVAAGAPALHAAENAIVTLDRVSVSGEAIDPLAVVTLDDARLELTESSIRMPPTSAGSLISAGGSFAELTTQHSYLLAGSGTAILLGTGSRATVRSTWLEVGGRALLSDAASAELEDVEVRGSGTPGPDAPAIASGGGVLVARRVSIVDARGRALVVTGPSGTATLEDLTITGVTDDGSGAGGVGLDVVDGATVTVRRARISEAPSVGIRAGALGTDRAVASVTLTDVAVLDTGSASSCVSSCATGPTGIWLTTHGITSLSRFYVGGTRGCGLRIDAEPLVSIFQSRARSGGLAENRFGLCVPDGFDAAAVALNLPDVLFRDNVADGLVAGERASCIEGSAGCIAVLEELAP